MKEKEFNKDNYKFELEMENNISLGDTLEVGRIPLPKTRYLENFGTFKIYEPNLLESLKMAYEGLFRIWEKQGKDPIEELKKIKK